MKTSFNKKKIFFFPTTKLIKNFIIFFIILVFLYLIYEELISKKQYREIVQEFSEKYKYQLEFYEINGLYRSDKKEIFRVINKYIDQSIFLIPLKDISDQIHNLVWIKNVNLSTNLKNKLRIEILEYEPIGLYLFNNQTFYFSKEGKIIDKFDNILDQKFIVFSGKYSLNYANKLLNIVNKLDQPELIKIKEANYINDRRWNLKFLNEITVFLSEKNIETSLINYIKLIKELKESEILSIKSIDLRNDKKAIINFK
tara:strand:+ start:3280 stop:4047 length:768 start_codon:yes stop_codon:yes gene_type:complete